MVGTIFSLLATFAFLSFPVVMIWGWMRWVRTGEHLSLLTTFSLIGFALANASESIAISMVIYARVKGGFGFYDPTLMRIYAVGTLLSIVGLILAIIGAWRQSSLRWLALTCTVGTLLYWFVQSANE